MLCQVRRKSAHGLRKIIDGFLSHGFSQILGHLRVSGGGCDLQDTGITWIAQRIQLLQFIGNCIRFVDKCKYFNLLRSFTTESNKNLRVRHSSFPHDKINVNSIVLCSLECRSIKLIVCPFPLLHR